jgi:hypothetical protein
MNDDLCLRENQRFKHIFEPKASAPKPDLEWLAPQVAGDIVLRNSANGRYQVRKQGKPATYSLWNCRLLQLRLIRDGFKSFDEVCEWIRRQP